MDATVSQRYLRYLLPLAEKARPIVPDLEEDLRGARMDVDSDEFLATAIARAIQVGASLAFSISFFGYIMHRGVLLKGGIIGFPILSFLLFLTFAYQPRVKANRIARELEKNLPFALRHMLIEVKSGISLYEAMVAVSYDYGEASEEFDRIVSDIQGGNSQIEALEESIGRNTSIMYRRAIWQMINALKSGADVTETLESLVDSMIEEQKLEVEKYGEDLNPFILMYLMMAVIFPSMGVTLIIVLSSFTGFALTKFVFIGILAGLGFFQLFFLNIVKTKRPEVKAA